MDVRGALRVLGPEPGRPWYAALWLGALLVVSAVGGWRLSSGDGWVLSLSFGVFWGLATVVGVVVWRRVERGALEDGQTREEPERGGPSRGAPDRAGAAEGGRP